MAATEQDRADPDRRDALRAPGPRRQRPHARLVAAACAFDAAGVAALIQDCLDRRGVVATWEELCAPALRALGDRWQSSGQGVDIEHLASECMVAVLGAYGHRAGLAHGPARPLNSRPVLLACAPDEMHSLPLNAVAAALAERRVASRLLGARVPQDALLAATTRSSASAMLLWAHNEGSGDLALVEAIPLGRHGPLVALGGLGWPTDVAVGRSRVVVVLDLTEAVTTLFAAAGG